MTARPAIAAPAPWSFPTPNTSSLGNGLEVHHYQLPGQHIASASWVLPLPSGTEPRSLEGVATILARTLDEGTQAHPGDSFADLLESEGAAIGASMTHAGLQVMLDVPTSHLAATLPLLAEAVTAPALTGSDIERQVALRLAEIEQQEANSASLAARTFLAELLDPSSRQSRPTAGLPDTVAAITPEAVRRFHQALGPQGSRLVLGGDLRGLDVTALAEAAFGSWDAGAAAVAQAGTPAGRTPRAVLVDRPGAVQADVRLGGLGIDRRDPRWAAFGVATYTMGGAFLSRLNRVLREERGYTYGVHLTTSPQVRGGTFALGGSFRTEVVVDAVTEALGLLDVSASPFTATEVRDAVTYMTGVSPLRYATADGVVDQAALQALAGLPTDHVDRHLAALARVTPETALEAYTSLVDPGALTLVIVGDATAIEPALTRAGIAVSVQA